MADERGGDHRAIHGPERRGDDRRDREASRPKASDHVGRALPPSLPEGLRGRAGAGARRRRRARHDHRAVVRGVERHPREDALHPRPDRALRALRRPHLQRERSRPRQAGPGPVPARGKPHGRAARALRGRGGQSLRRRGRPGSGHARVRLRRGLASRGSLDGPRTIVFDDMRDLPRLLATPPDR